MEQAPAQQEVRIAAGSSNAAGGTPASAPAPAQQEGAKSRKPANTRFKQQQLPAWQPMLTARSVLPFLVAIGLAFIPIGIALYLSASNVVEVITEYTDCMAPNKEPCSNETYIQPNCVCEMHVYLDRHMGGPVFMYYAMENFFQNHRKYVKSRDDNQLMGEWNDPNSGKLPSTDCAPFDKIGSEGNYQAYLPCGAIANSLFNDSIQLFYSANNTKIPVHLEKTDIAWNSDRRVKFQNPNVTDKTLKEIMESRKLISPKNWQVPLWNLDNQTNSNNGLQNEDLIVWMRTAAFPSFRKLYRRINHTDEQFKDGLKPGNYTFLINYNYPVKGFEGKKFVVLSSVSWIGGRNIFLGVAYMTVGSICIVLALVFFLIHIKFGKKPSEAMNVTSSTTW
ncbi:cell cycle control protein 50A-like isoform X2 [Paramacrobiotus metropolitanus]|uniref:cell cycle control protein 50A-like isoform X2 n=1 Tax=Paramacrobiotus metropolitanus TaxID=2943436 RepID=UPI002445D60B|nr:cell cycle control protein 50A-like isoform X2 [Paramacrobiotus metropolitanus]